MADQIAIGTLLELGDAGTPEVFTVVAGVSSMTLAMKTSVKDVTNHSSPGRAMQRRGVLLDPGDLKFKIWWDPNDPTHNIKTGLFSEWETFNVAHYKLAFPVTPAVVFDLTSSVTEFSIGAPVDGVLEAAITLTNFEIPDFTGTTF